MFYRKNLPIKIIRGLVFDKPTNLNYQYPKVNKFI
jgi:hypothetical protein